MDGGSEMQAPLKQTIRRKKIMCKQGGFSDYIWNPTGNTLFALPPRPSSCAFLSSGIRQPPYVLRSPRDFLRLELGSCDPDNAECSLVVFQLGAGLPGGGKGRKGTTFGLMMACMCPPPKGGESNHNRSISHMQEISTLPSLQS